MRYITPWILQDLFRKMGFIGDPHRVGKTTLARGLLEHQPPGGRYLKWDYDQDRQDILNQRWRLDTPMLVLDELHKYPRWKNWLKGILDTQGQRHKILVTGSARRDIYRRGDDSLMGRYHYWMVKFT
ncbi:MAG: AAA family ATPase [SAR324 cluster bacterium]|nr:AAA family ATPase [SAR324 cluster bacterium]